MMSAIVTSGLSRSSRCLQRVVTCTLITCRRTRGHSHNKFVPPAKHRKIWSAVETLQVVSKVPLIASEKSTRQNVLDVCQRFQDLGYEFKEISPHWEEVTQYNVWKITWATHSLLAEQMALTAENLLKGLQMPILPYTGDEDLLLEMSREQCINVLTQLLLACGADESSVFDLREKFYNYEISDNIFAHECSYAVCIARLLIAYLHTSPDSIISEYNCLSRVDLSLLIEQWQDMLAFGLKMPNEVVNYTVGSYMKPAIRGARSYATGDVLKLVGLSKAEADKIGFTKQAILSILHSLNLDTIENTYVYLLNAGYTRSEIAQVPFILAFSRSQIIELLEEDPKKFKRMTTKVKGLNFIGKSLSELYGHSVERFYKWEY